MRIDNEVLCIEYPFLKYNDSYSVTWLDFFPPGWRIAFGRLFCDELKSVIGNDPDFKFLQIKQKWGRLTMYHTSTDSDICSVIEKYSYISEYVCEKCGAPYPFAHMTYEGYVAPLCSGCFIKAKHTYNDYLQSVLKDSVSVSKGPSEGLSIGDKHISVKPIWDIIFDNYVRRTLN